ncbi:MAG TPA: hypothetical protein VMA72_14095 [Streptosporangiaceae bacterium]|nr:hypothetical protein [Streptosporangiaceae bacterium]
MAKEIVLGRPPEVVTAKGDRDMVSDVDVQVERAVRGYLREAHS